jgi:hypothetical protein
MRVYSSEAQLAWCREASSPDRWYLQSLSLPVTMIATLSRGVMISRSKTDTKNRRNFGRIFGASLAWTAASARTVHRGETAGDAVRSARRAD